MNTNTNKSLCMVSTCGTSLLTNKAQPELNTLVRKYANARVADEVDAHARAQLEAWITTQREQLLAADEATARQMSAELSAMLGYVRPRERDLHFLLTSDTWLGAVTGELTAAYLERAFGVHAQVEQVRDLQTASQDGFAIAMAGLVAFCDEQLGALKPSYHVVFNPTGGFKAVSGVMQTLAMLYADETIYIFEGTAHVLRLPRLPIKLDIDATLREHIGAFRLMAEHKQALGAEQVAGIPEMFLFALDGEYTLSAWGELVWKQRRDALYHEQVWPSPSPRVVFSDEFITSLDQGNVRHHKRDLNLRVDQLGLHMADRSYNPSSLHVHSVKGALAKRYVWMCDAWAMSSAWRIYLNIDGDVATLGYVGEGLGH